MKSITLVTNCILTITVLCLLIGTVSAQDLEESITVTIDTSGFVGTSGDIEFQLGGSPDYIGTTFTTEITSLSTDAWITSTTDDWTGDLGGAATVSGNLADNNLKLFNDNSGFNIADADQKVTSFGHTISFVVTFISSSTGLAPTWVANLFISVYDAHNSPLFTGPAETNYAANVVKFTSDATLTNTKYPAVPEPSTYVLVLIGGLMLFTHTMFLPAKTRLGDSSLSLAASSSNPE